MHILVLSNNKITKLVLVLEKIAVTTRQKDDTITQNLFSGLEKDQINIQSVKKLKLLPFLFTCLGYV